MNADTQRILIRELRPDDSVTAITELLHVAYAPLAAMGFKYLATHQDEATTQFAVRPVLQRKGLGAQLMSLVEQRALQHGATELALDTAEGATHLIRWYERLGFRFIHHVSWDETNYRSVVMSKRLTAPPPANSPTSLPSDDRPTDRAVLNC